MLSKRFLWHLILTLSWCQKNNIWSRWEKFASSYNPFFRVAQITILATTSIVRNTIRFSPWNGGRRYLRRNQRLAARAALVRCEPSTPRRDPRTDELVRSSRRRAQLFLPKHCSSEHNRACLLSPLWSSSRERTTRSVQATWWARTRNCSRSLKLAPNSSGSGPPPPSSRAAHWEGLERSPPLVPHIVLSEAVKGHWTQKCYERAVQYSWTNGASPLGLRWPSALGSDKARKNPTRLSFPLRVPRQGST